MTPGAEEKLTSLHEHLISVLSFKNGYFGRLVEWRKDPNMYIGYELTEDFYPTLSRMSGENLHTLAKVISFFEIHAEQLKKLLNYDEPMTDANAMDRICSQIAWSHFMTVVMFGMLEVVAKNSPYTVYRGRRLLKYLTLEQFLLNNLSTDIRESITARFKKHGVDQVNSFPEAFRHLWEEVRSGFVHDISLDSVGTHWNAIDLDDPRDIVPHVPMQDWLQYTWLSILTFYGYRGTLALPKEIIENTLKY